MLTCNEAIGAAALDIGVVHFTGYPGTPATSVGALHQALHPDKSMWSINEKVAMEVAMGYVHSGRPVLSAMKTLGLNVAADALSQIAGSPLNAPLVVVFGDDVGRIAADDQQDGRNYGKINRIPVFEPSSPQEAYDMTVEAFKMSTEFSTPVLIRTNTVLSNLRRSVKRREEELVFNRNAFEFSLQKTVQNIVTDGFSAPDRSGLKDMWIPYLRNFELLEEAVQDSRWTSHTATGFETGIICAGYSANLVLELKSQGRKCDVLKLGLSYPIDEKAIKVFCDSHSKIFVVEDGGPFIEEQVRKYHPDVCGHSVLKENGRILNHRYEKLDEIIFGSQIQTIPKVPFRLPEPCGGCPHETVNKVIEKLNVPVSGGIGCGALAAFPHMKLFNVVKCMGSSIGIAFGYNRTNPPQNMIAVTGDGEFWHTGINGLIDAVYNGGTLTLIIEDNLTTAMTGGQENMSSHPYNSGMAVRPISIEKTCLALGVDSVSVIDGYDEKALSKAVKSAYDKQGIHVVVNRKVCQLKRLRSKNA